MGNFLYTFLIGEVYAAESEIYYAHLSPSSGSLHSVMEGLAHSEWLIWGMVGIFVIVIVSVPRMLNRFLGLTPILGVLAFLATAAILPWALKETMSEQRMVVSSDERIRPTNIEVRVRNSHEVVISWQTSKEVISAVQYGTDQGYLHQAAFTNDPLEKKQRHEAHITTLVPGTTYYFELVSGGVAFSNDGEPIIVTLPE